MAQKRKIGQNIDIRKKNMNQNSAEKRNQSKSSIIKNRILWENFYFWYIFTLDRWLHIQENW